MMAASLVLAVAAVLLALGCWGRGLIARLDRTTCAWVTAITAWPIVVTYAIAPAVWADAESAGTLFVVLLYTPALVCSLTAVVRALAVRRPGLDPAAVVLGTLFVTSAISMVMSSSGKLVNLVLSLLMFVGFVLRERTVPLSAVADGARVALVTSVVCLWASVTLNPSAVVGGCRVDKCTELGASLTSAFAGNGNLAGIMVTVLLPFAAYRAKPTRVVALVLGVAAVGVLAGSRTAFIGIGIAALGAIALAVLRSTGARAFVLGGLLLGSLALSLLPVYVGYAPTDYSFRGYLWDEARRLIPDQLLFGYDPAFWVESGRSTLFVANYSAHNGWFEILLAVGIWGLIVIVVAAVMKVWSSNAEERPWLILYFATVLAISSMEAIYVPYFLGIAPFAAILPFFVFRDVREHTSQQVKEQA